MNFNATFFGQIISFIVFVAICAKYIWPPVIQAMRERQKSIAEGLAAAERAEKDLELAQNRAGDQLREAKEEAAKIIEQARSRAAQMVEEAKSTAREEGERQLEAARAQIDQEANRVRENLRGQVADLAVAGAERILKSSIDRNAHKQLLDQLAGEL